MKKLALAALLLATPAWAAVPAPKPSIATLQQLPVVLMQPYDEHADADAIVAAAFDRAKKSHKRVLIDFLQLPEMHRFMDAHYVIASVDVGRFDRNQQIPARFGITGRLKGVPALLIATPDGKLVNGDDVFATSDAHTMTPQALADYLAKYAG
jgi:hypothetical protein